MKIAALAVAFVCFVIAALYGMGALQIGASGGGHHFKHAVLFAVLGLLSLVWLRFQGNAAPSKAR